MRADGTSQEPDRAVRRFLDECVIHQPLRHGERRDWIALHDLYSAYVTWAGHNECEAMPLNAFLAEMEEHYTIESQIQRRALWGARLREGR